MANKWNSSVPVGNLLIVVSLLFGCGGAAVASGSADHLSMVGIRQLEVEAGALGIVLSQRGGPSLDMFVDSVKSNVSVLHERRGDTLKVWVKVRRSLFSYGDDRPLRFEVPSLESLRLTSSSGNIEMADVDADEVVAHASSGNVVMSGSRGDMDLASSSGSVEAGNCIGPLVANSSSGNLSIDSHSGDIRASTASGTHSFAGIRGDILATSSSGSIRVEGAEGSLSLETTSGNLIVNDAMVDGDCSFRTSSGSIRVDFANDLEDFTFRLTGSSGGLKAGSATGSGRLDVGRGRFTVTGRSSSGSQRYQ